MRMAACEDSSHNDLSNDVHLTSDQLKQIGLAMSISGGVGVLMAGIILIALLSVKAYKTILQRLFLYTVLTLIVHDLSH